MANNDLAMRFTENYYATKNEVSKELKISMIDGVWDKILSYRSVFYHYMTIKGVDRNQLRLCLSPAISAKSLSAETKLIRLLNEYRKLDRVSGDGQYFELTNLVKCLQNISLNENLVGDEESIKEIVKGTRTDKVLSNYLNALRFVESKFVNPLDDNYLAGLYSKVTGIDELTYFYRDSDYEDINSSAVVARVYKSAPHALIESMMDGLFNFVEKSTLSPLNKALVCFYYIKFVKPFKNYNDEIAVLFTKSVLAHDSLGEFAIYLPLESLINDNFNEVNRLFYEVQVTGDVTYYLTYALSAVDHLFEKMLDNLAEYSAQIIKNDFYQLDEELIEEEKKVEPLPEPVVPQKEKTIEEEVKAVIKPVTVEKKVAPKEVKEVKNEPRGLAVSYIPDELDEKTATRLERHLLELDVRLSKGQAYFYARHCTLGMYYTIEQYRKATKCVYETARTSMDKLVEYGYYEKGEAGKKYVYTPKNRN